MRTLMRIIADSLILGSILISSFRASAQECPAHIQLQTGVLSDELKALTHDGTLLAVWGPSRGEVSVWNILAGRQIQSIPGNLENVLAFSPDKNLLYKSGWGGDRIDVCEIETAKTIRTIQLERKQFSINQIVCTGDNKSIIIAGSQGIDIIDVNTGKVVNSIKLEGGYQDLHLAYNPTENQIIVGQDIRPRYIRFYDFSTCQLVREFKCHVPIKKMYVSNDFRFIVAGDTKGFAAFDYKTGNTLFEIEEDMKDFTLSPFHDEMVYASDLNGREANYLSLIDTRTWKKTAKLPGGDLQYNSNILFSGKKGVVLMDAYDFMTSWDFNNQISTPIFNTYPVDEIKYASLSDNGKTIITDIAIWDLTTLSMTSRAFTDTTDYKNMPCNNLRVEGFKNGVRLFDKDSLIATFVTSKRTDWVVYTPDGYWDCSINFGRVINYVKGTNAYSIDQFAAKTNRPDIILKRISMANPEAIARYEKQYRKRVKRMGGDSKIEINTEKLPMATILKTEQKQDKLNLQFSLSGNGIPISSYNIYQNDVPIYGAGGRSINTKNTTIKESIELVSGINRIEISCTNQEGAEGIRATTITYLLTPKMSDIYFLGFGVSQYKDSRLNLNYAAKDVLDLEKVIKGLEQKNVFNVFTRVFTDAEVTPEAIKGAKEFIKKAKPQDCFILFIAGHGMHDTDASETYYFLTSNADLNNLKSTAADFETIEDLMQGIPPLYKIFLMDACESGELDDEEYKTLAGFETLSGLGIASRGFKTVGASTTLSVQGNANGSLNGAEVKRKYLYQKDRFIYNDLMRRSGAIVLSSSKGGELSYERGDFENGLFTEFLIKGLSSRIADTNGDKIISIDELRDYILKEVANASNNLQHPTIDRDNIYQKFGFQVN